MQSVLETEEDFKWLKDVHGVEAKLPNLVEILGNEDAPGEIIVYEENHVDAARTIYIQNALGKYVRKDSLMPAKWRENFVEAYLEAAALSSPGGECDEETGNPKYESLEEFEFCDAAKEYAKKICNEFIDANTDDIRDLDAGQCGHDLWLTSAGHGTGWWDRGLGERGQRLTKASKPYADDVYLGDDGLLHLNSEGK